MSPRLVFCLVLSIAAGFAGVFWTVAAGWGWLAAFAAYSIVGSTTLIGAALAAALLVDLREGHPARPGSAEPGGVPATARSG
jgi:hypothetical protein